ncbi:VOC family protein [Nocardioides sp.]|uniref:VOC family protein n=1 Tax=Nocardioides sp. TaxID=35761 RepID=UPI0019862F61|nr:VOC family protein [Nocardioides sp.]MBC7278006.1 VOC family protein [Nocardioides sp.]
MDINIHVTFLPHTDPEASLAFYRDTLGFELRKDVGYENMRWLTLGPVGRPDSNIVLYPPNADPAVTEEESRVVLEMMAKGTFASIMLATPDLDSVFAQIQGSLEKSGAEVMQEPTDQDWGQRDCAFRDPAGNTVRMQQVK